MYKIFTAVVLAIAFTACTDQQAEAEIARLQSEKQSLQAEIQTLQLKLDSAKAKNDSIQKRLSDLDMQP